MKKKNIFNIINITCILFLFVLTIVLSSILVSWNWLIIIIFLIIMYFFNTYFAFKIFYDRNRINTSKKNWLFGFLIFPGLITFFYLWLAFKPDLNNTKNDYIADRKLIEKYQSKPELTDDEDLTKWSTFFKNAWDVNYSSNNYIKLIEDNFDLYQNTIELIRSAKKIIIVQYYIISDGEWFNTVANELIKKAKEGVEIYVLIDWIGSIGRYDKKIIKKMRQEGINFELFTNGKIQLLRGSQNTRNHKKILIIDNQKALYGGSNLSEEYLPYQENNSYWRDTNFYLEGEIVNKFLLNFIFDYVRSTRTKKTINEILGNFESKGIIQLNGSNELVRKNSKSFVMECNPNIYHNPIENTLLQLILKAKKSIYITTPYFATTDVIFDALLSASLSGIKVKILLPGKPDDKDFIIIFNQKNYERFKNSDIEIYEYNGFYHGKMTLIDNEISLIGSFNYDLRSIYLNNEDFIFSFSEKLNQELKNLFYKDLQNSELFVPNNKNKKLSQRLKLYILEIFSITF